MKGFKAFKKEREAHRLSRTPNVSQNLFGKGADPPATQERPTSTLDMSTGVPYTAIVARQVSGITLHIVLGTTRNAYPMLLYVSPVARNLKVTATRRPTSRGSLHQVVLLLDMRVYSIYNLIE